MKTERMRNAMRRTLRIRKIVRPRRMVVVEAVVGRMAGMGEKGGRSEIGGGRQRVALGWMMEGSRGEPGGRSSERMSWKY